MINRQCNAMVYSATEYQKQQCLRKGVILEDGKYWCKQHAPSIKAARDAKLLAKRRAEHKARQEVSRYERHAKEFHDALVEIAISPIGGLDSLSMRKTARDALDKMEEGE